MKENDVNLNNWIEILSDPETGRDIMSDYGNVINFIEQLLKEKDRSLNQDNWKMFEEDLNNKIAGIEFDELPF